MESATKLQQLSAKLLAWSDIRSTVASWQQGGEKVVFTNGCFDILHYGHLHYLAEASDLGDRLVIGLNSDASVKQLKGQHRPIHDLKTRQMMLASLDFVDAVIIFEEDTPARLIEAVLPDVLVKGGDYKPEDIVGYHTVVHNGGQVVTLAFIEGYSTTSIEQKIRNRPA